MSRVKMALDRYGEDMPRTSNSDALSNFSPAFKREAAALTGEAAGFLSIVPVLRRRWKAFLFMFAIPVAAAVSITIWQTPLYQARALVEVLGLNDNYLNIKNVDPTQTSESASVSYVQTQVGMLRSRSILKRVVQKLQLEQNHEFQRDSRALSDWLQRLGLEKGVHSSPLDDAVERISSRLKIQPTLETRLVEILFEGSDPTLAASVANTLASEYIEQNLQTRWDAAQHTGEWLTPKLDELKRQLQASGDALQQYARSTGLMFTGAQDSVSQQKLLQIQAELSKAQVELAAKQSQYELSIANRPESLPGIREESALREYQVKLTDLRRQLAELRTSFTPTHYKVRHVEAQIKELESSLEAERINMLARIRNELEAARTRERMLAGSYVEQTHIVGRDAEKTVRYNLLKNEMKTNQDLYEAMLRAMKELGVVSAIRANNIRLIDSADVPSRPYRPSWVWNSVIGIVCGVFLGVVVAFAREFNDRSIHRPGESSHYLYLPELGVIPCARVDRRRLRSEPNGLSSSIDTPSNGSLGLNAPEIVIGQEPTPSSAKPGAGADRHSRRLELVTWESKPSIMAESFRSAAASIRFAHPGGVSCRVIVITSTGRGEGKTTVVSNLGIALAETHCRVLLIDADLRNPRLHKAFGIPNDRGLTKILGAAEPAVDLPIADLVQKTTVPQTSVLTSGEQVENISELLNSRRLPELLRRLRLEFDVVLIDTPPVMLFADARVLGRLADTVILVVRAGQTNREHALSACRRIAEDGTPLLGAILNDFSAKNSEHDYYSRVTTNGRL